eukprot:CAMPEP_0206236450 /NCGR_PEP_ID=MMETSP0047_2-20121206/13725_1 /ASSEMBLY_ACC=CAM_ASM_000192 /TAXON_ID=195065 /ORGANISM="Chroomonas mesostigmatica_cf, Strain CCMP1168" /LENGTH=402 /DNA_ID=CAMNT_0053660793 /DNA_START=129 /DNA_END=1337 /DNA_ORIENTATION=+
MRMHKLTKLNMVLVSVFAALVVKLFHDHDFSRQILETRPGTRSGLPHSSQLKLRSQLSTLTAEFERTIWGTAEFDVFRNACIRSTPPRGKILVSFQNIGPEHPRAHSVFVNYSKTVKSLHRTGYISDKAGLFFFNSVHLGYNPNHCLHDIIFALLPWAYYVHNRSEEILPVLQESTENYCQQMLDILGWTKVRSKPVVLTSSWNSTPVCFETLLIPPVMHNRFILGEGLTPTTAKQRRFVTQVRWLKSQLIASVGQIRPLPPPQYILLITRMQTGKGHHLSRRWVNAEEVKKAILALGHHELVNLDVCDGPLLWQAEMFHGAQVVIGPHGGYTGNAIFMSPGSQLVEFHCTAFSWTRFWLNLTYVKHILLRADNPECNEHSPERIGITPRAIFSALGWNLNL